MEPDAPSTPKRNFDPDWPHGHVTAADGFPARIVCRAASRRWRSDSRRVLWTRLKRPPRRRQRLLRPNRPWRTLLRRPCRARLARCHLHRHPPWPTSVVPCHQDCPAPLRRAGSMSLQRQSNLS